jgi:hypothetical protein
MKKFNVETGDRTVGAAKIRREMQRNAAPEERVPFGQGFVRTSKNDPRSLRKASAPAGHGETDASFWQDQRAGPRVPEAV